MQCNYNQLVFVYQNVNDFSIECGDVMECRKYEDCEKWKHIATINPYASLKYILTNNLDLFYKLTEGGKYIGQ